ncbi:hypothetical protein THAOC_19898, partial [Thalassiosira oceanica]
GDAPDDHEGVAVLTLVEVGGPPVDIDELAHIALERHSHQVVSISAPAEPSRRRLVGYETLVFLVLISEPVLDWERIVRVGGVASPAVSRETRVGAPFALYQEISAE